MRVCRFCARVLLGVTLVLLSLQSGGGQQSPFRYLDFMQRLRRAESKQRQDREAGVKDDSSAVVAFIQSDGYPKAIAEAAKRGRDEDLRELYQAKFGTQQTQTTEDTPLLSLAARNGDAGIVKELIARGADVKATNAEKWTALHCAVEAGSVEAVKMLLNSGANINAVTARQGETPLMLACGLYGLGTTTGQGSKIACVRLLLKRGANVNTSTGDGQTALRFAANAGNVEATRLLLAQGADAALKDSKGQDALADIVEFENIGADGKITITQDSASVPTYKLTVFDDLIRHGKVHYGRYRSSDIERVQADALQDFLTIIQLLRAAENAPLKRSGTGRSVLTREADKKNPGSARPRHQGSFCHFLALADDREVRKAGKHASNQFTGLLSERFAGCGPWFLRLRRVRPHESELSPALSSG